MNIPWLDSVDPVFPDPELALQAPNGLLAAGGNLTIETLLTAYRHGIFPWYSDLEPILWWSPNPRLVLPPAQLHISRNLRKKLRHQTLQVSLNKHFPAVIEACSQTRKNGTGTWISDAMKKAYINLHQAGYAHSVEVFDTDGLIGGLYGVNLGQMFFGESMFTLKSDASKIALVYLCQHLKTGEIPLIDCQVRTDHLISLGAQTIPRTDFIKAINEYCQHDSTSALWEPQSFARMSL